MICKQCGNSNGGVGVEFFHCERRDESSRPGWFPLEATSSSKVKKSGKKAAAGCDPKTLQNRKETAAKVGAVLLTILKVVGVIALGLGYLLLSVIFGLASDKGHKNHCPSHYGYRYGRWYYGHGHRYGCQRGGNGGSSGGCYRD